VDGRTDGRTKAAPRIDRDREENERGNGKESYDGIVSFLRLYTHGRGTRVWAKNIRPLIGLVGLLP